MANPTPGPWRHTGKDGFILAGSSQRIAQTFDKFEYDFPNHEANGTLLAAAPDLLAACENMLRIHGIEEYRNDKAIECPCDGCKMARAAVAKAKCAA